MFFFRQSGGLGRSVGFLCAAGALLLADNACAQRYEQMPARMSDGEARLAGGKVTNILRNSTTLSDAQKKQLADFFVGHYFPKMTSTDAASLGELAENRQKFFRQYLNFTKSPQVRDDMVKMTMTTMGRIAMGNYHPAARYNAILAVGMLDEIPATIGADAKPPKPLPAGAKALIAVLTQDEIKSIKVPVSAKVGALVGLERHARFGIEEPLARQVTDAALALIAQKTPPEDVSLPVHHWMKCQAARVLANQFAEGTNPEVHQAMISLVADANMSMDDRCCAAKLLAKVKYSGATELNADEAALTLGELANTVLTEAAASAKDYQDELVGGGGFAPRRGGRGGGFEGGYSAGFGRGGAGETGPRLEKRQMLARLNALVAGIDSVAKMSPELTEKLAAISKPIDAVVGSASKKDAIDTKVARDVINVAEVVAQLVKSWRPVEADAEAETDAEAEAAESFE